MKKTLTVIAILAISAFLTASLLNVNYSSSTLKMTTMVTIQVLYIVALLSMIASVNAKFTGHALTFLVIAMILPLMYDFSNILYYNIDYAGGAHAAEYGSLSFILTSRYPNFFLSHFGLEGRIIACLIIPITVFAISFFIPPIFIRKRRIGTEGVRNTEIA